MHRDLQSLGVIPDYLYDGKGMRIDGVREGKPHTKADLQKGDIVLKMNDMEISDMMSYMKALAAFKQGESATLVIKEAIRKWSNKLSLNKHVLFADYFFDDMQQGLPGLKKMRSTYSPNKPMAIIWAPQIR